MKSRYGKAHIGWTAALAFLVLPAPSPADQTDARLSPLFEVLLYMQLAQQPGDLVVDILGAVVQSATTSDRIGYAERYIWIIWHESGREEVDRLLDTGIEEMGSGRLRESITTFGRIIDLAPEFAEGWNKRATAYYLAGELDASMKDVERTLALEPRHFGALSGLGLIRLAKGDELGALRAFEATLEVHPRARAARYHVLRLREKLKVKST